MMHEDELQEKSLSDTNQIMEVIYMKIGITRSAMKERDAQVSSELKAMGG